MPALAICLLGVAGCAQFDKSLGQQQADVSFSANTPDAVRLQVRAACGKVPGVSPVPLPKGMPLAEALSEVVYQVDNASDADIARLEECLKKYPSVAGISFDDMTDNE
jgi:hypothetical protein